MKTLDLPRQVELLQVYRQEISSRGYMEDPAQLEVLEELQRIADGLIALDTLATGWLGQLLNQFGGQKKESLKGLYLWGGVGRGKTFVMDLMFQHLPIERKLRVHFHRFMLSVHKQLYELKSTREPLAVVAADIAKNTGLLCLDELFVEDITDAMVLAALFDGLIEHGVVLIFTTNCELDELYSGGLQRERFLPAIKLLNEQCVVHEMAGNEDYRLRTLEQAQTYICPHCDDTDSELEVLFRQLAGEEGLGCSPLTVLGREIAVRMTGEGIGWFEFDALCDGPRSKVDYAELSRYFHTLIISQLPILDTQREDPARRFVELIDELYDRRVNVILSAADQPERIYSGKRLTRSFERTASRIREFSSPGYMCQPHRP
ncbi:MAG: cell division protein ZapE [Parasphingorhabdus sp.]|jgi:cell division protein ZapE